jgi:hypothetical protein
MSHAADPSRCRMTVNLSDARSEEHCALIVATPLPTRYFTLPGTIECFSAIEHHLRVCPISLRDCGPILSPRCQDETRPHSNHIA